ALRPPGGKGHATRAVLRGGPPGPRTRNLGLKRPLLCQIELTARSVSSLTNLRHRPCATGPPAGADTGADIVARPGTNRAPRVGETDEARGCLWHLPPDVPAQRDPSAPRRH